MNMNDYYTSLFQCNWITFQLSFEKYIECTLILKLFCFLWLRTEVDYLLFFYFQPFPNSHMDGILPERLQTLLYKDAGSDRPIGDRPCWHPSVEPADRKWMILRKELFRKWMIRYRKWRQLTFSSTWLERLPDLHSAQSCSCSHKSCPSVETHEDR